MRALFVAVAVVIAALGLGACRQARESVGLSAPSEAESLGAPDAAAARAGQYYTQFTLQAEKWTYRTTNYRRGFVLPINSEVTFVAMNAKQAKVRTATGDQLVIENMPKHTNDTMEDAFDELFARQPVDLSPFSAAEQGPIRDGRLELGMSKDAVFAALGPPPAIGTPSLDSNQWKYWSSRWATFIVRFEGGVAVEKIGR